MIGHKLTEGAGRVWKVFVMLAPFLFVGLPCAMFAYWVFSNLELAPSQRAILLALLRSLLPWQ